LAVQLQRYIQIDIFVNSVYVYDDKMVVTFNYKDGEICVTFDEISKALAKKENPDNTSDYQGSSLLMVGDPYESRIEVTAFCDLQ